MHKHTQILQQMHKLENAYTQIQAYTYIHISFLKIAFLNISVCYQQVKSNTTWHLAKNEITTTLHRVYQNN